MAARVSCLHVGALLAVLCVAIFEGASSAKVKVFRPGISFSRPEAPEATDAMSDAQRGGAHEGGPGEAEGLSGVAAAPKRSGGEDEEVEPSFDDSAATSNSDPTAEGPPSPNGQSQDGMQVDEGKEDDSDEDDEDDRQSDEDDALADTSAERILENRRRRPTHEEIFQSPVLLESLYKLFGMVDELVDSLREQEADVVKLIDEASARRAYDEAERLRSRRRVQMGSLVKRAKELREIGLEQFEEAPKAAKETVEAIRTELGGALPPAAARAIAAEPTFAGDEGASDDEIEAAEARPNKKSRRFNPSEAVFSTRSVPESLKNFAVAFGVLAKEVDREAGEATERIEASGESLLEDLRQAVLDSRGGGAMVSRWWRHAAEERSQKLVDEAISLKRAADEFVKDKRKDLDSVVQLVQEMYANSEKRIGLVSSEATSRISKR